MDLAAESLIMTGCIYRPLFWKILHLAGAGDEGPEEPAQAGQQHDPEENAEASATRRADHGFRTGEEAARTLSLY